ncbi:hypothetical protein HMPREF1549_00417 [Actinomyces johnsonii F0510]|uniref:Uncharacterized protein n=1 Tax=Actinomyces johnsonii F0510 TaxID=1227262 RepID=U1RQF7_9ACTO|nr:hypothetical protein HMPREF1549_00417 [Actinomyces johnsonii F0510]
MFEGRRAVTGWDWVRRRRRDTGPDGVTGANHTRFWWFSNSSVAGQSPAGC